MKYRILSDEELNSLAEDFKHFLIVNGVHAEEWQKINEQHPDRAISLVEIFSDTVLQKVYERLEFLEFRSENSCMVFHCTPKEMSLVSISVRPGSQADLSTPESIHTALVNRVDELQFFKSTREYTDTREMEIHRMLEQGCVPSDQKFWEALQSALN